MKTINDGYQEFVDGAKIDVSKIYELSGIKLRSIVRDAYYHAFIHMLEMAKEHRDPNFFVNIYREIQRNNPGEDG